MQGTKIHIAIKTAKLSESIEFYQSLFGVAPIKYYSDYAKFELSTPGLNLTLNQVATQPSEQAIDHLGIEFGTSEEVSQAIGSLAMKKIPHEVEKETSCCYGVQDKAWVRDPNGISWELYAILEADTGEQSCSIDKPMALAAAAPAGGQC